MTGETQSSEESVLLICQQCKHASRLLYRNRIVNQIIFHHRTIFIFLFFQELSRHFKSFELFFFFFLKSDKYKLHWSISSVWVSMLWSLALKANVRGITAPELRCLLTVAIKIKMNVCLLFLWVGACFLPGPSVSLRLIMFAVIHRDRLQHKETLHGTVCVWVSNFD